MVLDQSRKREQKMLLRRMRILLQVSVVPTHVRAWVVSALATSCCNAGCRQWADFPWLCAMCAPTLAIVHVRPNVFDQELERPSSWNLSLKQPGRPPEPQIQLT